MRYHLKERILNIKDDFVVRDDSGKDLYDIRGKLMRIADSWRMFDAQTGEEVLFVKQRLFTNTREYNLIQNNSELATVRLQARGSETRFEGPVEINTRDGMVIEVRGDFKEWD